MTEAGSDGFRLIQISDTHLSDRQAFFVENYLTAMNSINRLSPDLIVHTGDLTVNGVARPTDLSFAAAAHRLAHARLLALPGNHDVGEEPGFAMMDQPVSVDRLQIYRDCFGADWWAEDVAGWRLIGLNAQVLGSGLPDEAEQLEWLSDQLDCAGRRPVGVFLHKPLFFARQIVAGVPARMFVPSGTRARLLSLLLRFGVRFVASGHLHKYLDVRLEQTRFVWAPATAYRSGLRVGTGAPMLGYLDYCLFDDGTFAVRAISPPGMKVQKLGALKGGAAFLKDAPPFVSPQVDAILGTKPDIGNSIRNRT